MHEHHSSPLENWQAIVGLISAVLGIVYVMRKPKAAPSEALPSAGPAGFGEVAGGGGGGGVSPTSGEPASPKLTGQQNGGGGQPPLGVHLSGHEGTPGGGPLGGRGGPQNDEGQLVHVPRGTPAPGESQGEYERSHARPGAKQQTAVM